MSALQPLKHFSFDKHSCFVQLPFPKLNTTTAYFDFLHFYKNAQAEHVMATLMKQLFNQKIWKHVRFSYKPEQIFFFASFSFSKVLKT